MYGLLSGKRVLVAVAHPDDEVLGPGGTIFHLSRDWGCEVHVVILGEGLTSRAEQRDLAAWQRELAVHKANIATAREALGVRSGSVHDYPDNRFDTVPLLDLVKEIEREKASFDPEVVLTHHGGDVNVDHQLTFEAVVTACRPMPDERVRTILTFETASGTEWRSPTDPRHFHPNVYLGISERALSAKITAMEAYAFEKRPFQHPRSPDALRIQAQRHGVAVGLPLAEAFALVRSIATPDNPPT